MATTAQEQFEEDRDNAFLGPYNPFRIAITYFSVQPDSVPDQTTGIYAEVEHLPDLSPATQKPLFRRAFYVSVDDVTPKRGDELSDPAGDTWKVYDIERPDENGMVRLQTQQLQTKA